MQGSATVRAGVDFRRSAARCAGTHVAVARETGHSLAPRPERRHPRCLAKQSVSFIAIKENIRVEGKQDIQIKVMTTLFALFADVERGAPPISERTREGLARARASGKKLGRPKGSLGVSRLDGKEDEIRRFLKLGVSKSAIAEITWVSRPTLYHFVSSRGLSPGD